MNIAHRKIRSDSGFMSGHVPRLAVSLGLSVLALLALAAEEPSHQVAAESRWIPDILSLFHATVETNGKKQTKPNFLVEYSWNELNRNEQCCIVRSLKSSNRWKVSIFAQGCHSQPPQSSQAAQSEMPRRQLRSTCPSLVSLNSTMACPVLYFVGVAFVIA